MTSTPLPGETLVTVPLHSVAHGRAGDKGNRLNVSLMPYDPAAYALLADQITEDKVLALFTHRDVLEGGVNGSLNLDGHGKSNSFILLGMAVTVPRKFVRGPVA
jgi:hypothetical protein